MKKSTILLAVSALFLLTVVNCNPDKLDPNAGCFVDKPLETISWAKAELASFQRPKSGPLSVTIYAYQKEYFLAFENPFLSSPMSHIYDCSGKDISDRGIRYNNFMTEAKKLRVLLEANY